MKTTHLGTWLGLATTVALMVGCVAAPAVIKTKAPSVLLETYGQNANPPDRVKAVPVGEVVVIPPGRAALTLFVAIPQKAAEKSGDRKAQYLDYSRITQIEVTITGENLNNPVRTTFSVSSGSSAAGTVVLAPGRNQIIQAVAKDSAGKVVSTVQGVATSLAGQVVNAEVKYGTTPAALVVAGLDPAVAPQLNLGALDAVLTQLMTPTTINGTVTYGTHPSFINPAPLIQAIKTLVDGGTPASQIASYDIWNQLYPVVPIFPQSSVTLLLKDVNGNALAVPSAPPHAVYPVDRNGDGLADGTTFRPTTWESALYPINLSDPVSLADGCMLPGMSQTTIAPVPPGTYELTYDGQVSSKPWETLPILRSATVSVAPGANPTVSLQLVDVSTPVDIGSGGSFSSEATNSHNPDNLVGQWFCFPTSANLIYQLNYDCRTGLNTFLGYQLMIFDQSGAQMFQGATATGSYTFVSSATGSLYVYTPSIDTTVNVTTEPLNQAMSSYNAIIDYNQ